MAKQPDNWFDDNTDNIDEDEIIWISKSKIKRDAEVLKKLGAELVELSKHELERIPLNDELLESVELAQKIKREGRKGDDASYNLLVNYSERKILNLVMTRWIS